MNADVIVIGAGPAGLEAAAELARNGKKVIVLEKKKSMEVLRRACSMQLILDDDYEGEGVVVEDDAFRFPKTGFSVPYHGKLVPIYNKYYHSPQNHVIRFATEGGTVPFSYKFDKRALLLEIYNECLSLGVEFRLGVLVRNASDRREYVSVNCRNDEGFEETLTARKLVNAEGVNAFICGKLGFNAGRPYLVTALCLKFIYKGLQGIEPGSWNLYYGKAYYSNAAVIIGPSLYGDDTFEVTISSDKNNVSDMILFDLVNDSPLKSVFKGGKIVDKMACAVRAYMPIKEPCRGNVIVIGDAAAFVEVEIQGALLCGYRAAKAVTAELEGKDGWSGYTDWWQNAFEFNSPDYLRVSQGYALVPTYTDDELDYLFGLVEDRCLPGTYSQYKTPMYIWDAILSFRDRIKEERPETYEKIRNLSRISLKDSFG